MNEPELRIEHYGTSSIADMTEALNKLQELLPPPPGEMVERVAGAIHDHWARGMPWENSWADATPFQRERWIGWARVIIAAMREPTPEMLRVAYDPNGPTIWRDMIDAALKEPADAST